MLKPGWKTTEFWAAAGSQLVALLVAIGAIGSADGENLTKALTGAVVGVFAFVASGLVLTRYIAARADLKIAWLQESAASPAEELPPVVPGSGIRGMGLAVAACLVLATATSAQQPGTPASILPWRQGIERKMDQQTQQMSQALQQIAANQQQIIGLLSQRQQPQYLPAPATPAPQIIVLGPPLQQIPLGGPPRQDVPLGGPPRQDIPLGGPPRQDVPLGGPPRQDVPLGGPPRQQIDPGRPVPPAMQIPLGPPGDVKPLPPGPGEVKPVPPGPGIVPMPMPQVIPTGPPTGYQRYSAALIRR